MPPSCLCSVGIADAFCHAQPNVVALPLIYLPSSTNYFPTLINIAFSFSLLSWCFMVTYFWIVKHLRMPRMSPLVTGIDYCICCWLPFDNKFFAIFIFKLIRYVGLQCAHIPMCMCRCACACIISLFNFPIYRGNTGISEYWIPSAPHCLQMWQGLLSELTISHIAVSLSEPYRTFGYQFLSVCSVTGYGASSK